MSAWDDNISNFPELEEIKNWIDQGNKNDFYDSIISQANKRMLSQAQIDSAKRSFDKIKNPQKKIAFDDIEVTAFTKILGYMLTISPMGYDFYNSISSQIRNKKELSEKQWDAVRKKFYRFRKSLLRTIFTGSTKK